MASIVLILLGVVVPGAVIAQQSGPPSTGGFPGGAAGPATGGGAQPQPEAVPNVTGGSQGSSQGAPLVSGPLTNVRQQRQESSSEKPRTQESIKKDAAASPKQTAKKAKSNGKWSVQVSPGPPLLVTVKKADDVPIADLAAQISKKSKIPFVLSDLVRDQLTTADFADLPFEAAVKYFAPSGFIDYSMKADYSEPPKPLLVYLCGINEKLTDENAAIVHREQAKDAAAKGFHQNLIVVSGDTETPTENPDWKRKQELFDSGQFEKLEEENPIKVSFTDGRVTVNAQKQSLMAVINAIAAKADIEANIDGFADATNPLQDVLVTIDKKNATLEEVLMSLSPYIVLHVRTDLETSISKPIRIILVAPKPYAVPVAEDSARTK
jgi:hypothetical protein